MTTEVYQLLFLRNGFLDELQLFFAEDDFREVNGKTSFVLQLSSSALLRL